MVAPTSAIIYYFEGNYFDYPAQNPTDKIKLREMLSILNKLEKDNYIQKEPDFKGAARRITRITLDTNESYERALNNYFITFDGKLFIERGGYVTQEKNKILALEKQSADLTAARRSNIVLAVATFVLALDPIIRGLLWLFHHVSCH